MKANFKVILPAIGVAALLAFPAITKAQAAGTVTVIRQFKFAGEPTFPVFSQNGMLVQTVCHDGGMVKIEFVNVGSGDATLNFIFSDGTTVHASGLVVRPNPQPGFDVPFNNKRIEGQFIFANNAGNTTVSLHAFDGGTFCETQGTAQFGPVGP
jgi:hypothetical protein